jgi:plastocyanin
MPRTITVGVGDSVKWTNKGRHPHTTTARDAWDSGRVEPDQSWTSQPFNSPGMYQYVCQIHTGMRGTLIVRPGPMGMERGMRSDMESGYQYGRDEGYWMDPGYGMYGGGSRYGFGLRSSMHSPIIRSGWRYAGYPYYTYYRHPGYSSASGYPYYGGGYGYPWYGGYQGYGYPHYWGFGTGFPYGGYTGYGYPYNGIGSIYGGPSSYSYPFPLGNSYGYPYGFNWGYGYGAPYGVGGAACYYGGVNRVSILGGGGTPGYYAPPVVTVRIGDTVTWTNCSGVAHTSTHNGGLWDSGNINPGGSFTFTFATVGNFPYYCRLHGHTGTVVVTALALDDERSTLASGEPTVTLRAASAGLDSGGATLTASLNPGADTGTLAQYGYGYGYGYPGYGYGYGSYGYPYSSYSGYYPVYNTNADPYNIYGSYAYGYGYPGYGSSYGYGYPGYGYGYGGYGGYGYGGYGYGGYGYGGYGYGSGYGYGGYGPGWQVPYGPYYWTTLY